MSSTSWRMMLPRGDMGLGGIEMYCVGFLRVFFGAVSQDNVNCLKGLGVWRVF